MWKLLHNIEFSLKHQQLLLKDMLFDGILGETNLRRDEDRCAIKFKE